MDIAQLDRAQKLERKYDRRAARAQRSKWLGKLLFSLIGMGLFMLLRLNPEMVMTAMSAVKSTQSQPEAANPSATPQTSVRKMPRDFVPVRRGGDLPGNGARAPQQEAQAQADALGDELRGLSPKR